MVRWRPCSPLRGYGATEHRQLEPRRALDAATRHSQVGLMSRISLGLRAGEPVQRPAFGVCDSQHEHMTLVLFERDHVWEPLDDGLADQRVCGPSARPLRVGVRGVADSIEGSRNLGDELVA